MTSHVLYKIATLLVLTTLWLSDALSAPLVLEDRPQGQRAEGYLSVLRDPSGRLDFDQVRERLVGVLVTLARALGLAPDALWIEHAFQMGVSLEVMLFSLALAQRIELLRQEKQQAQQRAETDPLTGLFNRDGLLRRVNDLRDQRTPYALMVVDLDRFKPVNDQLGHEAGDAVLIAVAERMRALVRAEGDSVARIGGDEFVLILRGMTHETDAGAVAAKLLESLTAAIPTPAGEARIGASIGLALSPADGQQLARLLQVADQAMYRAKQDGRNRWHYDGHRNGHQTENPSVAAK